MKTTRFLFGLMFLLGLTATLNKATAHEEKKSEEKKPSKVEYAIVVHGGAGGNPASWSDRQKETRIAAMTEAVNIGKKILAEGGTSLDAVEQVVRYLENNPMFNAGRGAVFTAAGKNELDAAIMDGSNMKCGAVAGVTTVKNPISLARKVMTETKHVLLISGGAETFADEMEVERVDPDYFKTRGRKEEQERAQEIDKINAQRLAQGLPELKEKYSYVGTVGCVALDKHGNLAAATSTGGMSNKKYGRVGDVPIIGAGTFADNRICGISCTGHGEEFIRHSAAHEVSAMMKYGGKSLQEASNAVIHETLKGFDGGMICIDKEGNISMPFNTRGMPRAAADSNGLFEVKLGIEE
ncbi:MAG: isoaspartyl peptidase/L-asparaginase [Pirellulaceae bacterium]|nr:isoaspartyl peptidase/L-asparaginase [Pirellulaceae bacterium]